jgi:hypothetical protein
MRCTIATRIIQTSLNKKGRSGNDRHCNNARSHEPTAMSHVTMKPTERKSSKMPRAGMIITAELGGEKANAMHKNAHVNDH